MLQTLYNQEFSFSVSDSTVLVNPGVARVGNSILPFRGDSITFNKMTDFSSSVNQYQYSALILHDLRDTTSAFLYPQADLTSVVAPYADSTLSLRYPTIPKDSSAFAIGLFLFGNPDSTVTLIASDKVIN